jgi:hypothetical protein
MKNDLIVWCGPVFAPGMSPYKNGGEIGDVKWKNPTEFLTVSCTGGSCGDIAESYRGSDGRILENLLAQKGYGRASDWNQIALAGYSAGHNFMNRVLQSDGDLIAAMVSIDACYSATDPPWTKQGYVDFGTEAAKGNKLMVLMATGASHGGQGYPSSSGSECAGANFDAAAAAAGVSPQVLLPGLKIPPTYAERAGELVLLDYGTQTFSNQLPHFDAINLLSEDVLQTFLAPYLGGARSGRLLGLPWWCWALGIAGALGAGAAGVAVARRR